MVVSISLSEFEAGLATQSLVGAAASEIGSPNRKRLSRNILMKAPVVASSSVTEPFPELATQSAR